MSLPTPLTSKNWFFLNSNYTIHNYFEASPLSQKPFRTGDRDIQLGALRH